MVACRSGRFGDVVARVVPWCVFSQWCVLFYIILGRFMLSDASILWNEFFALWPFQETRNHKRARLRSQTSKKRAACWTARGSFASSSGGLISRRPDCFWEHLRVDIMEMWFRTQFFSRSCLPRQVVCHFSVAISHTCRHPFRTARGVITLVRDKAAPIVPAKVVAGGWRLHVHVCVLSLWCCNCVQNGRFMCHLSICQAIEKHRDICA